MVIDDKFVRSQTTLDYYDRGDDYYHEGRVRNFVEFEDTITATVSGSQDYKTKIDLTILDYECDCPAYAEDRLCKHLVAVFLTKINGQISKLVPVKKNKPETKIKKQSSKSADILKPGKLKQEIDKLLNGLDRYWGNYWACVDQQQRIFEFVSNKMNYLDDTSDNSKELLITATWLDKELENFDDSDGILQDTVLELISKAVRFLENSQSILDLDIFYGSRLWTEIVEIIFDEVENPLISDTLGEKIEKDGDLHTLIFWSKYLKNHNDLRFEVLAQRYYLQDITMAKQLAEFYVENKRYKDAILIGWPQRHHFMLDISLLAALEKVNEIDKLIQYYQENCQDHLNRESLGKLKEIYIQNNRGSEWEEYSQSLLQRSLDDMEKVDLLMMLKRYVEAAKILGKVEFWHKQTSVLDYAKKLAILDKQAGIVIYRLLLSREAQKMATSNFYPRLIEYIDKLVGLGDVSFIKNFIKEMQERYPTKNKLQYLLTSKKF